MSHEKRRVVERVKQKISHAEHHLHDKVSHSGTLRRIRNEYIKHHEHSTTVSSTSHKDEHHQSRTTVTAQRTKEVIFSENAGDVSITKIDVEQMTARQTRIPTSGQQKHLLKDPKYVIRRREAQKETFLSQIGKYPIRMGFIALALALWKPISSYLSGFIGGCMLGFTLVYLLIEHYFNSKTSEEWIEFPQLEQIGEKMATEDQSTTINETNVQLVFGRYEADNDEFFVRYPVIILCENHRLTCRLATNSVDRSSSKHKWIGYREYSLQEASLTLAPEATLTRRKYWLVEYPIVIQNVQMLDKQMIDSTFLENTQLNLDDFFNNPTTTLSLFFETAPEKEDCFHKLASIIRIGSNGNVAPNRLLSSFVDRPSTNELDLSVPLDPAQSKAEETEELDLTLAALPIEDSSELEGNELNLSKESDSLDMEHDLTGTKRTASKRVNETTLEKVLNSVGCLDEAAVTINSLLRRLMSDLFTNSFFPDLLKEKLEEKLKEISAVAIFDRFVIEKVDLGNVYPVVLKIEPIQWNTKGIWLNLFLYYHGSIKIRVRTQLKLEKLLERNRAPDEPMFKQHHPAQKVHKQEEKVDEDDILGRRKILVTEPEVAEIVPARKLGNRLQNLVENRYFQAIAGWTPIANLLRRLSHKDVGADIEVTDFFGALMVNIPPPPSDRLWIAFPEVPNLQIKVSPFFNKSSASNPLLQDFLAARIRDELKRTVVLPAMDDQLLPFFRDWVLDVIGEIAIRPLNDNIKHLGKRSDTEEDKHRHDLHEHSVKNQRSSRSNPTVAKPHVHESKHSETLSENVEQGQITKL